MSARHVREMQLDESSVRDAAGFSEAYARRCLQELDRADQAPGPLRDDSWVVLMDAATAFREAGQWRLLFDADRSRELLSRAGSIYASLGLGFGYYLRTVADLGPSEELGPSIGRGMARLMRGRSRFHRDDLADEPEPAAGDPLNYPQQQAYLLLSAAAYANTADDADIREMVSTVVVESPYRIGVSPVGALGIPVRRFWSLAAVLSRRDQDEESAKIREYRPDPISEVAAHVHEWTAKYVQSIELAMANERSWRHAAAPVDAVDLDICGVIALAAHRFGLGPTMDRFSVLAEDLSPLASVQVQLGMELAERYRYEETT